MKVLKISIFLLLASSFSLFSQSEKSYQFYMDNADYNAVLFRGPFIKHILGNYQGTFYAYSETFTPGDIFYNGKMYHDVWLNLDAYRDDLTVRRLRSSQTIVLDKNLVEYFVMNGHKFINMKGGSLPDGFYEILYDGESELIKKVTKKLFEEESLTRVNSFTQYCRYFVLKDDVYYPIKGKKSFSKLFKDRKKEIRKVSRQAPRSLIDDKDAFYQLIITEGCNQ